MVHDDYNDSVVADMVLTDRQKFNMVMPKIVKIGNSISYHSTNQFFQYLEDLDNFEKLVRRRQRLSSSNKRSNSI